MERVRTSAQIELDLTSVHLRHADFVWRSLQRLGVRRDDLEDALQDVFVVVHRKLATFDGSSQITTWLFAICLRVASARRRRAHVFRERFGEEHEVAEDPSENPEAAAISRQDRARLEQVLDGLEIGRRAVFVMFEIERLRAAQIADILGVPVGTVYSRLNAAREEFRKAARRLQQRDARGAKP